MIKGRLLKYEPIKSGEAKLSIYVDKAMMPEVLPLDGQEVVIMSTAYWMSLPQIDNNIDNNTVLLKGLMDQAVNIYRQLVDMTIATDIYRQSVAATLELSGLADIGMADGAEPLTAPDEFEATHDANKAPANEFYGVKEAEDAD